MGEGDPLNSIKEDDDDDDSKQFTRLVDKMRGKEVSSDSNPKSRQDRLYRRGRSKRNPRLDSHNCMYSQRRIPYQDAISQAN